MQNRIRFLAGALLAAALILLVSLGWAETHYTINRTKILINESATIQAADGWQIVSASSSNNSIAQASIAFESTEAQIIGKARGKVTVALIMTSDGSDCTFDTIEIVVRERITVKISEISDRTYTGSKIEPAVSTYSPDTNEYDGARDKFVIFGENIHAGIGTVSIVPSEGSLFIFDKYTATFTILPAKATVTPDAVTKKQGEADPPLTAAVTGLMAEDQLNYTLSRVPGEDPGEYPITVLPGDNPDYDVTVETGRFTITESDQPSPEPDPAPSPAGETEKITFSKLKSVKLKALSAKKIEVRWKKLSKKDQKKIQKIQIQYSTDKTFKTYKTKWAKKTKSSVKISGLKKNTKYWVRIRAYKKSGNIIYVSKWITKNKKTKKK